MRGRRWWDPKGALFWQIVTTICAWGFIVALHFDNDGLSFQIDAARHAANGVFWSDYLGSLPASPRDFALAYYARYPVISPESYPPVFYLLEAAAYRVFGVSAFVGKGLALGATLLGSLYLVAWLRRWVSEDAGWAGSLFVMQPSIITWGNAVMLNVPSMVLGVAALYHWRRWLEDPGSRQLYAAVALAMLAVLTYLSVGVVLIVMLAWGLWGAGSDLLRERRLWIAAIVISVPIGAWILTTMPWDFHWKIGLLGGSLLGKLAWSHNWLRALTGLVTIPVVVLAAAGVGLGVAHRAARREIVLLVLWVGLTYVWLLAFNLYDLRYAVLLVPPIVLLAAIAVVSGLRVLASTGGTTAGWPRLLPWAVVLALSVGLAAATGVPRVSGFREIVRFVGEVAPSERVFYDGYYNGVFSFYTRAADTEFHSGVVLGSKLLYAPRPEPMRFGVVEIASSPDDVRESLRFRCGCRILVIERQISPALKGITAVASLREVVTREPAHLLRSFRVEAGFVTDVDVYEWRSVESVPSTIDLPFPSLGKDVRLYVKPIQP